MIHKKITTVFLLGQYGSGKDTHGSFVAEKLGLAYLSFSAFLSQDDDVRKKYIEQGQLVPDPDVFRLLASSSMKNVLFNGFPRTLEQLRFVLQKCRIENIAIVYLDVADEIAVRRMEHRVICSVCKTATSLRKGHALGGPCKNPHCKGILQKRPDDTPKNIIKRTASFREKTLPIIDEAEKAGMRIYHIKLTEEQPIEKTQEMIRQSLCESVSWS